jgi:hypothetical protein
MLAHARNQHKKAKNGKEKSSKKFKKVQKRREKAVKGGRKGPKKPKKAIENDVLFREDVLCYHSPDRFVVVAALAFNRGDRQRPWRVICTRGVLAHAPARRANLVYKNRTFVLYVTQALWPVVIANESFVLSLFCHEQIKGLLLVNQ